MRPFLTIVVPVFDRIGTIGRCLDSVRAQDFTDWEAVCVDDCSRDGSHARLLAERDAVPEHRIVVASHARNRGVCPARNTAIDLARGEWLVFLDSDDELAGPSALSRMALLARASPADLHALWFRSRLDDGRSSPADAHVAADGSDSGTIADWDYRSYLGFLERTRGETRDMIRCVRRSCFAVVRYPDSRMLEDGFHLDFARRFRSRLHPDVLRLYHADAPNGLARHVGSPAGRRDRALARDRALGFAVLLETHGTALAGAAPRTFRDHVRRALGAAWRARAPVLALRAARATASAFRHAART